MHQLSSISSYVPYSFLSVTISRVELKLTAGSMSRLKATKMTNTAFISSSSFRKLRNQVFDNKNLRKDTKVMVYKAVCITTLFYRRRGLLIDVIRRPWKIPPTLPQKDTLYPMGRSAPILVSSWRPTQLVLRQC